MKTICFRWCLKFLFLHGANSGSRIAEQIKLPFTIVEPVLAKLKVRFVDRPQGLGGRRRLSV